MLFVLVVVEILLQLASLFPPVDRIIGPDAGRSIVPDPLVGYRGNPALVHHDARGFSNAEALEHARVVCIGDSHTAGASVSRDHSWPRVLARKLDTSVYNMGIGGHSPAAYRVLAEEALELNPDVVVVGLYIGNDLREAWERVWIDGYAPVLRAPLQSDPVPANLRDSPEPWLTQVGEFLRLHCRTLGLFSAVWRALTGPANTMPEDKQDAPWDEQLARVDPDKLDRLVALESPRGNTLLTPRRRLQLMDRTDPRIAEGFRLTLNCVRQIHELLAARGIRMLVACIPTKEAVLGPMFTDPPPALASLLVVEAEVWADIRAALDADGIPWVDPLPALRAYAVNVGVPYRNTADSHPGAEGYELYADAVLPAVRKLLLDAEKQ